MWAMTPRWLGPSWTHAGMRARSPAAAGPAMASAALSPARFHALDADMEYYSAVHAAIFGRALDEPATQDLVWSAAKQLER